MKIDFRPDTPLGKHVLKWWGNLEDNKGDRALLRRADSPTEVMLTPPFQRVFARLERFMETNQTNAGSVAAVIGLLSHVRYLETELMARQMAGNPPEVSEMRFRRLLQRDRGDELYTAMIRVIRKLKYRANIHDLANSVFFWGDRVKKRWAFDYFPNTPEKKSS